MKQASKKDVGVYLHGDGAGFRVWAPFAKEVAVAGTFSGWAQVPLASEGDGHWFADIKKVKAGHEYKFVINGSMHKNDPRALQLTSNSGNSLVVDTAYDWGDDSYTPPANNQQVMYELHIGTFHRRDAGTPGTFDDAAEKLDYLKDLGITAVEIMPIASMSNDRGWGYVDDYIYAVEMLYGGRRAFLDFVKAAHQRGIGVILDVVYNHFGPDEKLDLWQFDGWNENGKGGIYFYNDWRSTTPWGESRPDYGRAEVRQYILDNVRMWLLDCHVDGLRVDSTIFMRNVKGFNDDPGDDIPEGWSLLQDITALARKVKPGALLIAEDVGENHYITKPASDGGAGFASQWDTSFPYVLHPAINVVEDKDRNLSNIGNFLNKHFNNDAFQRVIFSDSHDTAANGKSRLSEEIAPGNSTGVFARRRSLLAAAIVLTMPGIPMLFQGQEFVEGGYFNDWQTLDWQKAETFKGIVEAYQHLIALRKNKHNNARGLTGQCVKVIHCNEEQKVLAYHRWEQGGPGDDVIIVANFGNQTYEDYEIYFPRDGVWRVRFNSDWKGYSQDFKGLETVDVTVKDNKGAFKIAPYAVLIFSQDL